MDDARVLLKNNTNEKTVKLQKTEMKTKVCQSEFFTSEISFKKQVGLWQTYKSWNNQTLKTRDALQEMLKNSLQTEGKWCQMKS